MDFCLLLASFPALLHLPGSETAPQDLALFHYSSCQSSKRSLRFEADTLSTSLHLPLMVTRQESASNLANPICRSFTSLLTRTSGKRIPCVIPLTKRSAKDWYVSSDVLLTFHAFDLCVFQSCAFVETSDTSHHVLEMYPADQLLRLS